MMQVMFGHEVVDTDENWRIFTKNGGLPAMFKVLEAIGYGVAISDFPDFTFVPVPGMKQSEGEPETIEVDYQTRWRSFREAGDLSTLNSVLDNVMGWQIFLIIDLATEAPIMGFPIRTHTANRAADEMIG